MPFIKYSNFITVSVRGFHVGKADAIANRSDLVLKNEEQVLVNDMDLVHDTNFDKWMH